MFSSAFISKKGLQELSMFNITCAIYSDILCEEEVVCKR